MNLLFEYLDDKLPHLIVGDFNSLLRSDYSDEEWQEIYNVRASNNWELPESTVIENIYNRGYIDCGKIGLQKLSDNNFKKATCWAKTRIDFVFASNNFMGTPKDSFIFNSDISDHHPVLVDFEFKT